MTIKRRLALACIAALLALGIGAGTAHAAVGHTVGTISKVRLGYEGGSKPERRFGIEINSNFVLVRSKHCGPKTFTEYWPMTRAAFEAGRTVKVVWEDVPGGRCLIGLHVHS